MSGVCEIHPLSEEARRQVRPYIIMGLSAYFGSMAVATGVIVWACFGQPVNLKLLGLLVALPALTRHFGWQYCARQMARITGNPMPRVSVWSHVGIIVCSGAFIIMPWLL